MVCEAERAFPPRLGVLEVKGSLKKSNPGICGIGAFGCRCGVFSCARPRMCRLEVWVAALNLIEALSHTPIKQVLRRIKVEVHQTLQSTQELTRKDPRISTAADQSLPDA